MIQLLIALGGAFGCVARYEVGRWIQPGGPGAFPWGTFAINIAGSLLLGLVYTLVDDVTGSPNVRALVGVGFCGGFTTFSTFSFDAVQMLRDGQASRAAMYIVGSVVLCLIGTYTGIVMGSALLARR